MENSPVGFEGKQDLTQTDLRRHLGQQAPDQEQEWIDEAHRWFGLLIYPLARAEGLPVREEPLPLDTFRSADEAFLSRPGAGACPRSPRRACAC